MLSLEAARERADTLVARARAAGADAADVIYIAEASESIAVRLGRLEDVERSESEHIGLRVFAGHRSASIAAMPSSTWALLSSGTKIRVPSTQPWPACEVQTE